MKRLLTWSGLALVLAASAASAQGINLSLNDCGEFGIANAQANCGSNTGLALSMVGSVIPPPGVNRMVAFESYIDVVTSAPFLSPWWQLDACHASGLSFNADFTGGPFNCNDFFAGLATIVGGISPVHTGPNRFRILFTAATVAENPIDPGLEHYLYKVNILRAKSTGTGSCPGCNEAACLVLNGIRLNQPANVGDPLITNPIHRSYVTYNNVQGGGGPGPFDTTCPGVTPARNRTWGHVKALYR